MEPGGGGRNPAAGSKDNAAVVVQIQSSPRHPISPASPQFASFPQTPTNIELVTPPPDSHRVPHASSFPISPSTLSPWMTSSPVSNNTINLARRKPRLLQSEFSKPKSRLVEPPPPYSTAAILQEVKTGGGGGSPYRKSPYADVSLPRGTTKSPAATPITPRTPLIGSPELEDDADIDDKICKTTNVVDIRNTTSPGNKKWKVIASIELAAFVSIVGVLIASLTIPRMNNSHIWGLRLWKWFVLLLVIFCGRLATEYTVNVLVFLIERNFLLKKKVLYFIYGLKDSFQVFIWIGLVLLAWGLLFHLGIDRSPGTNKVLNRITRAISGVLIAAGIWLLKTLVIKLVASSYHVNRFFDRIQESIFHQYVLRALSGPPVMEMAESVGRGVLTPGQLSFRSIDKDKDQQKEEVIDMDKLKKLKHEKVSAWTMKGLVDVVLGSGLSTLSSMLEFTEENEEEYGQRDYEITSEWEAKAAAYKVFRNVAKSGSKYIDEEDLLRFLKKEEVDNFILLFEGASATGKIKRSVFKKWLVKVYKERKSLAHSLNDTKTAIEELNKLVSVVLILVSIVVWLLVMGFLSTQVLVFISSQILLAGFMFGNTARTVFEAIVFVFVMHPFDVGDRCVVDGIQMTVEEMNLLTTVFLRYDNEKIFYPNSVLAAKPISNFYRSPQMSDSVEFAVDVSTSMDDIGAVKGKIKAFLESKPQYWRPDHSVLVKGIEDMNKMHMGLYVNHTMNFQNGERGNRISDLVVEMKKIFEEIGKVLQKAQEEVRKVFSDTSRVEEASLHKLNYLDMIISESLRLHPPLPLLVPRENDDKAELNGYDIPMKTQVIVNAWAINRNARHWADPHRFYPERFTDCSADYKGNYHHFIPFGAGRRMCPGVSFGVSIVKLTLANLFFHFDWKLPDETKQENLDMTEVFGVALKRKYALRLVPIPYKA